MRLSDQLDEATPPQGKVLAVGLEGGLSTPLALEIAAHLAQTLRPRGRSVVYVEAGHDNRTLPAGTETSGTLQDLRAGDGEGAVLSLVAAWSAAGLGIVRDRRHRSSTAVDPGTALLAVHVLRRHHDWVVVSLPTPATRPGLAEALARDADRILWQAGGWRREGSLPGLGALLRAGVRPERVRLTSLDGAGAEAAGAEGWEVLDVVPHQLSWPATREHLQVLKTEPSEAKEWLEYVSFETTGEHPLHVKRSWIEKWQRRKVQDPDVETAIRGCRETVAYSWGASSENELAEWLQGELGNRVDTLSDVLRMRGWTGLHGLKESVELTKALTR